MGGGWHMKALTSVDTSGGFPTARELVTLNVIQAF